MKLAIDSLVPHLAKKSLAPVYIVSGDEPLQKGEACDVIRQAVKRQGYTEREVLSVDTGFDWEQFLMSMNSMSLFSDRRLLELRLPTGKPGDKGSKALRAYAQAPPNDVILLLIAPKLDKQTQKSKWYSDLDRIGISLQVWPIEVNKLAPWVNKRMKEKGLSADPEAVAILVERVEGNLLAAAQEIEKLVLLYGSGHIGADAAAESVMDSSRFNIYALVDVALQGDVVRSSRMLRGLKSEGAEAVLVLWALTREIRQLATMAQALEKGARLDQVISKARVWSNRKGLVTSGLKRYKSNGWQGMLQRAADIDRMIKGLTAGNVWDELLQLCLLMAGKPLFSALSPD